MVSAKRGAGFPAPGGIIGSRSSAPVRRPDREASMGTESEGSITRYLADLRTGDDTAARLLWERYFDGLVRLARQRLRAAPQGAADEEDVALSAFHSLCAGAARGHFERL